MKISSLFIVVAPLLLCSCVPIPVSEVGYRDDKVTVREKFWWYCPWPHGAVCERSVMRVCGRSYSNVRGSYPCYLELPGTNTILFVTGGDGSAVVHLVDLTTHKARRFRAYDSDIGSDIGRNMGSKAETILSVENQVALLKAGLRKSWIDLQQPRFIREERYFRGPNNSWYHCVFEGGRATWPDFAHDEPVPAPEEERRQ